MRYYSNLYEAVNELKRNILENGQLGSTQVIHNKVIPDKEKDKFIFKEVFFETFIIGSPSHELSKAYEFVYGEDWAEILQWALEEFKERIDPKQPNPGEAYKLRSKFWQEYLDNSLGEKWSYTYSERLHHHHALQRIIKRFQVDPYTRRQVINLWDISKDLDLTDKTERVPCSISYSWLLRGHTLNMFYHMRSCDLMNHFLNDMYLACMLNEYIANKINAKPGFLGVVINSLHIYKDYHYSKF